MPDAGQPATLFLGRTLQTCASAKTQSCRSANDPIADIEIEWHSRDMIVITVISIVLLLWNAIYCARKAIDDFRSCKPASGLFGVLAIAGAGLPLGLLSLVLLLAHTGV
jgi:hypothetical protein